MVDGNSTAYVAARAAVLVRVSAAKAAWCSPHAPSTTKQNGFRSADRGSDERLEERAPGCASAERFSKLVIWKRTCLQSAVTLMAQQASRVPSSMTRNASAYFNGQEPRADALRSTPKPLYLYQKTVAAAASTATAHDPRIRKASISGSDACEPLDSSNY